MAIELKNLIDEACRRFERNFSAGDAAKLVNDYYASDVLIVGEGEFSASNGVLALHFGYLEQPQNRPRNPVTMRIGAPQRSQFGISV